VVSPTGSNPRSVRHPVVTTAPLATRRRAADADDDDVANR